jgi:hypothetical protein
MRRYADVWGVSIFMICMTGFDYRLTRVHACTEILVERHLHSRACKCRGVYEIMVVWVLWKSTQSMDMDDDGRAHIQWYMDDNVRVHSQRHLDDDGRVHSQRYLDDDGRVHSQRYRTMMDNDRRTMEATRNHSNAVIRGLLIFPARKHRN